MTHLEQFESAQADFQHLERETARLIVERDFMGGVDFAQDETFTTAMTAAKTLCIERAVAALAGIKAEQARSRRSWRTRLRAWLKWFWNGG